MLVLFLSSVQTRCSRQDCSQIWFCFVFCIQYQGIFLSLVLLGNAYVMIHILGRCSRFTATTLISSVQKKRKKKQKQELRSLTFYNPVIKRLYLFVFSQLIQRTSSPSATASFTDR